MINIKYTMHMKRCASLMFLLFLVDINSCAAASDLAELEISAISLPLELHSIGSFSLSLSKPVDFDVSVYFNYSEGRNIDFLPDNYTFTRNSTEKLNYSVTAESAGHTTVFAKTTADGIDYSSAFIRVGVFKVSWLNVFSTVVGWLYFICWSVSFYPQIIDNYRRKSVVGLNFDFLGLNLTGFIAYSVYNIGFYFTNEVQSEYHELHPTGIIPVELNDVIFAVHATFATAVTIGQCFIYERGNQLIAKTTVGILALVWSTAGVFLLITALNVNKHTPWFTFLTFFSIVKLVVTLTKYIPQVVYNYQRQSTKGWSIGTVLLDIVGGLFSILQMFINAYNYDDWHSLFGNFTKFGLGLASMVFDVIFMTQHYCLYRQKKEPLIVET